MIEAAANACLVIQIMNSFYTVAFRVPGRSNRNGWIMLGLALFAGASNLRGQLFNNPSPIVIPGSGPASPYPSTINVTRTTGVITELSATLNNITHVVPDDLDVLLVGPGGQSVMLMSDVGGTVRIGGVDVTFSADASGGLPDAGPLNNGTFRPTDFEPGDVLPEPAPAGPVSTNLGIFTGTAPNGTWKLFAFDDNPTTGGGEILEGWSLNLETAVPVSITSQPRDQTVDPGDAVEFSIDVSGTPPFGYQWSHNGEVVVPFGEGGPTLTLENVQAANAGFYSVVVTNSATPGGIISNNAILSVNGPLALVAGPQDQFVAPGESTVLQVAASGTPPLNYLWRLNGVLLPDQTNAVLSLDRLQPTNGGGFSVTVWNGDQVFTTQPAFLQVRGATDNPPVDDFANRPQLDGFEGVMQGNNLKATAAPGEPLFPGGGKTVWSEWVAPDDGIVTLTSQGSAFDTVLGVFTGGKPNGLTLVTMDDDNGGFHTSQLQFNAVSGTAYQWMLDGLGTDGSAGEFTLTWKLEPTAKKVPVIVVPPRPTGVGIGGTAVLTVSMELEPDELQWLFNGEPIPGATGDTLTLLEAGQEDVGFYSVIASNSDGLTSESPAVPLQVGFIDDLSLAEDQIYQLYNRPGQGIPISVGLGDTGWNEFPSAGSGEPTDPEPCDQPFFKTIWQSVTAEENGVLQIDTSESQVFLLLGVYEGVPTGLTNLDVLVACDTSSGPFNQSSLVQFNASQGSNYTAVVSALQGVGTETIKVTARLGTAPTIPDLAQCLAVEHGGSVSLMIPVNNWSPSPTVQWRFNGIAMVGETNVSLMLADFDAFHAGTYSVVLSNFVDSVTNTVAHVAQSGPPVLQSRLDESGGGADFVVMASADMPFALETAVILDGPWSAVATNPVPCFPLSFTNFNILPDAQRFFRAVPWTPPGE